jgi:hypothetical protein
VTKHRRRSREIRRRRQTSPRWLRNASPRIRQVGRSQRRNSLARPEDGIAVRMIAPHRGAMKLEDEIVRRIIDSADLLEHHLALESQVGLPKQRTKDQVGEFRSFTPVMQWERS